MEARPIEVRLRLRGLGVEAAKCEARLGIRGDYTWNQPHLPAQHAWGFLVSSRSVHLSEVVEPILARVHAVRDQWIALLDENPGWTAGLVCTVTIEEREPRHGDFPCLTLEPDQIRRMAGLRLEFDLVFR